MRVLRSLALAAALTLPLPAWAIDFLIAYTDESQLFAVAAMIPGLTYGDGIAPGHGQWSDGKLVFEWAVTDPVLWRVPTGETMTDAFGNSVPVMVEKPGWYRMFRLNGDPGLLVGYVLQAGGTMEVDPTTGGMTITAAGVTMTSLLPAYPPIQF